MLDYKILHALDFPPRSFKEQKCHRKAHAQSRALLSWKSVDMNKKPYAMSP